MKIQILSVGKIKEKYLRDASAEYEKRLSRYCSLSSVQVADEKTPDGAPAAVLEGIKKAEGERLLSKIQERDFVVALAIEGESLDSEEFSEKLEEICRSAPKSLTFVIGGSLGLSREVLARADLLLSFSRMTFPHQLMKIILLEQVYRAFKIARNEPYHK